MDLFRSEEMSLVQLIIPAESAHDTITYLAELGLLQFKDVSAPRCLVCSHLSILAWRSLRRGLGSRFRCEGGRNLAGAIRVMHVRHPGIALHGGSCQGTWNRAASVEVERVVATAVPLRQSSGVRLARSVSVVAGQLLTWNDRHAMNNM